MYNGDYLLDGNLGHEIINMYQSDNGKNYIYLQSRGSFDKKLSGKFGCVLLVRGIGNRQLEIIGKAEGLTEVYNKEVQIDYIKTNDVRYGGVLLNEIFADNKEQQDICITFKADKVLMPKKRMYIQYGDQSVKDGVMGENVIILKSYPQAKTSLKQYISPEGGEDDYNILSNLINDDSLWGCETSPITEVTESSAFSYTIFDICGIQDRELSYTNALAYFLRNNKEFAHSFVANFLSIEGGAKGNSTIFRERENIDLLIEDEEKEIIIENKIKSSVHSNQLDRYIEKVEGFVKGASKKTIYAFVLTPDYNDINISVHNKHIVKYKKLYYSDLYAFMEGCSDLYGKDVEYTIFTKALERHTVRYSNPLYEDMRKLFLKRIESKRK